MGKKKNNIVNFGRQSLACQSACSSCASPARKTGGGNLAADRHGPQNDDPCGWIAQTRDVTLSTTHSPSEKLLPVRLSATLLAGLGWSETIFPNALARKRENSKDFEHFHECPDQPPPCVSPMLLWTKTGSCGTEPKRCDFKLNLKGYERHHFEHRGPHALGAQSYVSHVSRRWIRVLCEWPYTE